MAGDGPAVVLVHGAFLDRRQWDPQRSLRNRMRLLRYDTRWHGSSAGATTHFSGAGDLAEVLDAAEIERATIVGLSNGARIAIDFALAYPTRVDRLVLASPDVAGHLPTERPAFWTPLIAALGAGDHDSAARVLAGSPIMAVGAADSAWVGAMVREHAKVFAGNPALEQRGDPPAIQRLREITAPTLIIVGDNDLQDIQRIGTILADSIAGARLVRLVDARHLLSVTHAAAFNRLLRDFVEPQTP
jgi:pimeloyl-ACP methyl ester carboxylesterase